MSGHLLKLLSHLSPQYYLNGIEHIIYNKILVFILNIFTISQFRFPPSHPCLPKFLFLLPHWMYNEYTWTQGKCLIVSTTESYEVT